MVFSLSTLWWGRIWGLWKLPDGKDWWGKLGLVLISGAMLSKPLIQFSIDWGRGRLCSLPVIYLGPNYGEGDEDNGDLLPKVPCTHCYTQCPQPCIRPLPTHTSAGESWTLPDTPRQVWVSPLWGHCSCLLGPGMHKVLFVPFKVYFPV